MYANVFSNGFQQRFSATAFIALYHRSPGANSMPTIKDVARMAGVSPTTVSRVLNRKMIVRKETEERVWAAVEALGYQPDGSARALVTGQTAAIGIIVRDICDPFFAPIVHGITAVANVNGYSSFLCNLIADPSSAPYLRLVHEKRVDGVIIATSHIADEQILLLVAEGVPLVLVNRRMDGVVSICTDNEKGAYEATSHLVELGHCRIAYIDVPSYVRSGISRRMGYERALREHGLPLHPDLVTVEENSADGGYRAATDLLSLRERPTAVLAYDDVMAIGALRALQESGVRMPEDMAVVGYDDIPLAAHVSPPLTTVRQAMQTMGIQAMQMLIRLIRGEDLAEGEVVLQPELIVRRSSCIVKPWTNSSRQ
jgi:LacI family transcriptional regulator